MASRKALDRLNLRLHINEDNDYEVESDPYQTHKELLRQSPETRTAIQTKKIHLFLEAQIHLRLLCHYLGMSNEHGIEVLSRTAQLSEYEFQRTSVWETGDEANHFYIVLYGSVSIQVPFQNHLALATERILHPGETFGEIGLLNGARTRTAGIRTADNNTSLLHIPRETFIRELGPFYNAKYTHRLKILNKCPAFTSWPQSKIKFISQVLYERTVHLGDAIASEGDNVENKYFLMILRRGQVRVDKHIFGKETAAKKKKKSQFNKTDDTKNTDAKEDKEKPLHLCVLSPGSMIFEPRLVQKSLTLEQMVEAAKIDRGEHSTTRWSCSFIAKTSVRLWCISRHTYFNIPPDSEHLIHAIRNCIIKLPSRNVLLAAHCQEEKWSKFKARQLIDIYSEMDSNHRNKLLLVAKRNVILNDKEHHECMVRMEKEMGKGGEVFIHNSQYLNTNHANNTTKDKKDKKDVTNKSKNRATSVSSYSDALKGVLDLSNLKENLMSKSLSKQHDGSIEYASHEEDRHVEESDSRPASARRRRGEVNVALIKGTDLSLDQRALLIRSGRENRDRLQTSSIQGIDNLSTVQPFVQGTHASLNNLKRGMLQTGYLGGLIEGNIYTYRVPSVIGNNGENGRKKKSIASSTRNKRLSNDYTTFSRPSFGNSLSSMQRSMRESSRIRHVQTADEKDAMYHGGSKEMRERGKIMHNNTIGNNTIGIGRNNRRKNQRRTKL